MPQSCPAAAACQLTMHAASDKQQVAQCKHNYLLVLLAAEVGHRRSKKFTGVYSLKIC